MRLLIFGGTRFLSRELARLAVEAGHDVTCAARGQSGAVPDGVRFIAIDRSTDDGLEPLAGTTYDAVVDPATRPSWVHAAVDLLRGAANHWTYISSCSVYDDEETPGQTVSAPVKQAAPQDCDETDMEIYGQLKMASEGAVRSGFPDSSLICRPGLIVGPGDMSGRFTYWPERLADGGEVLAPGGPDDLVQVIDVRDLAAWLLTSIEAGRVGVYDAISQPMPRRGFLAAIAAGVGLDPHLEWVDQDFLVEHGVAPWMGPGSIPVWLPLPAYAGFMSRDLTSTIEAGLNIRPLAETARDTLNWIRDDPTAARTGLSRDDEARLLDQWRTRDR